MKTIVCLPAVSGCSPAHQIVDPAIAVIVNTMPQLCGPMWRPNRVRLTRDPSRDRSPFTQFFKVPVEFGVLTAGVVFDASALDWPVRDRNPDYAKILTPLLDDAVADAEGDFVSAVKSVIRVRIGAGALTRESVCRALGVNARTLSHRLEVFGVAFSDLADEERFDAAQSLLLKGRRIPEIVAVLGFAGAQRLHTRLQGLVVDDTWAMARKAPRRQNLMVESALNALPRVRQATTRGSSTTGACRPRDGHRLGCRPGERSSQSVRTSRNTRCCGSWSDVLLKIASAITLFILTGDIAIVLASRSMGTGSHTRNLFQSTNRGIACR